VSVKDRLETVERIIRLKYGTLDYNEIKKVYNMELDLLEELSMQARKIKETLKNITLEPTKIEEMGE